MREWLSSKWAHRALESLSGSTLVVSGLVVGSLAVAGCTRGGNADAGFLDVSAPDATSVGETDGSTSTIDAHVGTDVGPIDAWFNPDGACASARVEAEVERRPVDIIWLVDNSTSMEPAVAQVRQGMNAFAQRLVTSGLDYRLILLSLRGDTPRSNRYPVCIPQPLAGPNCADGDRFFQIPVDLRSTQPIEQLLGTLGQSTGYRSTDERGSEPWAQLLRPNATKTIVLVTDDNQRTCDNIPDGQSPCQSGDPRFTALALETFPGGGSPFGSLELGPGILTSTYGALFEGYTFNAIYGWGDANDPDVTCTYPGQSPPNNHPPSPGQTYTTLVERTGGVRAQLCTGASAWTPFFASVAETVVNTSRIDCEIGLPPPPDGMLLDPSKVNVAVLTPEDELTLGRATDMSACDPTRGGWYFDDNDQPQSVILCPASCDDAQERLRATGGTVDVRFGCDSLPL